MNILYLEDDFINAEQSKNIINFYNNHSIHSFEYRTDFNNVSYGKIVKLSKEMLINENIDFSLLNINEEDAYEMVANNVLTQMYETPEDYRDTVMMASMTKILVENLLLKAQLQKLSASQQST